MTELEAIAEAQDGFRKIKKGLKFVEKDSRSAGRLEAANGAMGLLGKAIALHSEATVELYKFYPDHADGVVGDTRRGGR